MLTLQKKLSLKSSYHRISRALWDKKRLNAKGEQENKMLRTKAKKMTHQNNRNTHVIMTTQLESKFLELSQKNLQQINWIKQTNHLIEQRNYQVFKQVIKKIENKLNRVSHKALRLEKKIKMNYIMKDINIKNKPVKQKHKPQNQNQFARLEREKKELQHILSSKEMQLNNRINENREFNEDLIYLLQIKNLLRDQQKRSDKNNNQVAKIGLQ